MKARFKMLKRDGKGNKPKASVALSDNEVDILYSKNILGSSSAHSLINTLWLNNCIYFGLRSGLEHRNLRWGDVQLFEDSEGCEFLEVNERQTKTRQGEDVRNVRSVKPRMMQILEGTGAQLKFLNYICISNNRVFILLIT